VRVIVCLAPFHFLIRGVMLEMFRVKGLRLEVEGKGGGGAAHLALRCVRLDR
jgi:hypothetical protein